LSGWEVFPPLIDFIMPSLRRWKQMQKNLTLFFLLVFLGIIVPPVQAHVPYIELLDYSEKRPFIITDSVENSKSIYAWFESPTDIDVYTFEVTDPVRLFANAIVPVCPGYEDLLPWLAVVGPGLPASEEELPFSLPEGYGAVVVENLAPGEPRETFYEFFGAKYYYYVAVIGAEEVFSLSDIIRSLIVTPLIWFNLELHIRCPQNNIP
jgi:hypothetical protein